MLTHASSFSGLGKLLPAFAVMLIMACDSSVPTADDQPPKPPNPNQCTVEVTVTRPDIMINSMLVTGDPTCSQTTDKGTTVLSCLVDTGKRLVLTPHFVSPLNAVQWDGPCSGSTTCAVQCADFPATAIKLTATFGLGTDCWSGGNSWCMESALSGIRGVWGVSDKDYWAVGVGGLLWHHGSDGSTAFYPGVTTATLRGIWGTANTDIWAVGESGTILHFDGMNWASVNQGLDAKQQLFAIAGIPNNVWIVGDNGLTLKFDGRDWTRFQVSGVPSLYGVWVAADGTAVAVGTQGTVIETSPKAGGWREVRLQSSHKQAFYAVWGTDKGATGRNIWIGGGSGSGGDTILNLNCTTYPCDSDVPAIPLGCNTMDSVRAVWGDVATNRVWGGGDNGSICLAASGTPATEPSASKAAVFSLWAASPLGHENTPDGSRLRAGTNVGILMRNIFSP